MSIHEPPLSFSASLRRPIIDRFLEAARPQSVVEVGCGLGAMAHRLASRFDYRGYEPDQTSYQVAARRLAQLGRGLVRNEEIPDAPDRRFGALCAFEVLEHIEDDSAALASWVRWLEPGGAVVLSVPANPDRFSSADTAVGHYRRYTRVLLEHLMADAGIQSIQIAAWGMPAGYLLEAGRRLAFARSSSSGDMNDRTLRSGRMFQPTGRVGRLAEVIVWPFTTVQRPFEGTDVGVGFVATGRISR
jgi:SAM-dependent methyltransferase